MLYEKECIPFSTLNFINGTEQPPCIVITCAFCFYTRKVFSGVWVALEDTNKYNGALKVVPKSHRLPIVDFNKLNLKKPDPINTLEKCYRICEDYVRNVIKVKKLKEKPIYIKR